MEAVIRREVATSKILGYNLGVKLIRGAYMDEERQLATENGYESPVWDTIEDTHVCYNKSMNHVIDNIDEKSILLIASHNVDTVKMATDKMIELSITDNRIRLAQLKGFSD